jgi:hypothetical protein
MINFDMIGRLKTDTKKLTVGGIGTSLEFDSIVNLYSKERSFSLGLLQDGYGPSDHSSFYSYKIPVLFFTTGAHEDYHKPADKVDKIDFDSEKAILDYVFDLVVEIANMENPPTFQETGVKPQSRGRKYKVTLGIIPDVTSKGGLGVDGVRAGGPAERGGMTKGDLIVAMNGLSVANIYEYMARIATLDPGQTVTVEVMREGEKKILLIQL